MSPLVATVRALLLPPTVFVVDYLSMPTYEDIWAASVCESLSWTLEDAIEFGSPALPVALSYWGLA